MPSNDNVTELLDAWSQKKPGALEALMEVVYEELRAMAGSFFKAERREHTLQPTALVHELYAKLTDQHSVNWHGRKEFFAVAARGMRHILVDHARKQKRLKRGGGPEGGIVRVSLDEALGVPDEVAPDFIVLDGALEKLERLHPRQARIVEMRILVGLTLEEVAAVEKISRATVAREWRTARLFLMQQLQAESA